MTVEAWRQLPVGDRSRWRGYALEWRGGEAVRMVVKSPDGAREPPPLPGIWRRLGQVDGGWTWGA